MKFLVDAQLPPELARWLQAAGHEASHVEDAGLRHASDQAIWTHALASGQTLITKDEDFAERGARGTTAPAIVWLRIGNSTNAGLRAWIESRLPGIIRLLREGNRVVEVI